MLSRKEADILGKQKLVLYRGTYIEQAQGIVNGIYPFISWWTDNLKEAQSYISEDDGALLKMEIELTIELVNFFKYAGMEVSPYTGFGVRLNVIDDIFNFSFSRQFLEMHIAKKISIV